MGIGIEFQFFTLLLFNKIERSFYNRRKRKLFSTQDAIREKLVNPFHEFEDHFIVDSMPLEICKLSRSLRGRICRELFENSPNRGYCVSQSMKYYGYKLHAVCSINVVIGNFDLSKASIHNIHYLKDIKNQMKGFVLLADKDYLSSKYQLDLFTYSNIKIEVPMRGNQYAYTKQPYIFSKSRKKVKTLFSQFCDQFMIQINHIKYFKGFKDRVLPKITALTIVQFINKFYFNRNINNLNLILVKCTMSASYCFSQPIYRELKLKSYLLKKRR